MTRFHSNTSLHKIGPNMYKPNQCQWCRNKSWNKRLVVSNFHSLCDFVCFQELWILVPKIHKTSDSEQRNTPSNKAHGDSTLLSADDLSVPASSSICFSLCAFWCAIAARFLEVQTPAGLSFQIVFEITWRIFFTSHCKTAKVWSLLHQLHWNMEQIFHQWNACEVLWNIFWNITVSTIKWYCHQCECSSPSQCED